MTSTKIFLILIMEGIAHNISIRPYHLNVAKYTVTGITIQHSISLEENKDIFNT